ncbi:DUF309 domain-containing protein [Pantanalinema rosaneae CENA516]|uniref:DUF309 domain-containing protein n=1 Tax=Pantanalinema rosaneae TaxID=1620701 RepID=UPI003D6EF9D9
METIPEAFWLGVEQFNQQQFYACHDTLEALWMEAIEADKKFYQGILQIAVALHHLENHNWRGAVILLGEGMSRLQGYRPDYAEIDLDRLLEQTRQLLQGLQQTGAEHVAIVAQSLSHPDALASTTITQEFPELSGLRLPRLERVGH